MSFDIVTGAWSRAALQPRLSQEISRARRSGGACSVFLFDVDFFKTVNDVYGHLRGDAVLRQISDRVTAAVRGDDTVFRYGGDEFVVLLPDTDRQEAVQLALRLTETIRATPFVGEPPLHLSISLGVATYPRDADDAISVLRSADRRNYLAKHRGRGGAVADDVDTAAESGSSRLWERDVALSATHDFLTRLAARERGALQVSGPPGAGHTRFLQEVQRLATLRGFTVVHVGAPPQPDTSVAATTPVLLIADVGDAGRVGDVLGRWAAAGWTPPAIGVAYASVTVPVPPPATVPLLSTVDLAPWSPATQRIWLRSVLQGEPSDSLVNWIARESGGLPAAAVRELQRLRQRDGVVPDDAGGWTVSPTLLGRPRRQVRLPAPVTGLVGREHERSSVAAMLRAGRMVTLVGPGGIGKTRLSLSAAEDVADEFHDGVVFVALADTSTADEVTRAIARVLRVDEVPGQPLLDGVAEHLADSSLLLVLDNLEQALAAAPVFGHLLATASDVVLLATSREPLSVYGEQVYRVPPLPLPDLRSLPQGSDGVALALSRSPAVALFDQRARAAGGAFALDVDNLAVVTELCRLLDGLPLAIELAAARTDRLDVSALLDHLRRHLDALGGGPADRPERQQTLRGAIDWSYELLDTDARLLFEAVAMFTGGCTVTAVLAVAEPTPANDAPDVECRLKDLTSRLDSLVAKSLLFADGDDGGEQRYRMLETIHAYAVARLTARGETAVRDRHRAYYLELADGAEDGMSGPHQATWVERLDREYANLHAAATWSMQNDDVGSAGLICLGLWRYWRTGNHIGAGRAWFDRVLGAAQGPAGRERAALLYPAAVLAATQDDDEAATRYGRECLDLAEVAGDRRRTAQARNILGVAALRVGTFDEAHEHFRFGLDVWRELQESQGMAMALGNLAKLCLRRGDIDTATVHIEQCLALERAAGNSGGVLLGLECLGEILLARADADGAAHVADEALALSRELGDVFGEAMALHQRGLAAQAAGERADARQLFLAALDKRHEVGDRDDLAVTLDCLAELLVGADPELATRLLGGADQLRRSRPPISPADVQRRDRCVTEARAAAGGAAFAAAWRSGRAMPLETLIDQAHSAPIEQPEPV